MLSYEDIFTRHTRPTTYLTRTMESPVTRRRTPVILRSPPVHKEVRHPRPFSTSSLDSSARHFTTSFSDLTPRYTPNSSTDYGSRYISRPSTNIVQRHVPKSTVDDSSRHMSRPLADITTRFISKSITDDDDDDNSSRHLYRPNTRHTPKPFVDIAPRQTTKVCIDDGPRNISPLLRKVPKLNISASALESISRHNYDINYRLGTTFGGEKRLGRREIPLCTPDDLLDIIIEPTGCYELPTDPWNEVYPDIYLSDGPTALCTSVLKRIGITHVLNAAQGKEKGCGQVNTWSGYYSQSGIKFLGVPAFDNIVFKIYPYFKESAEFIDDGLKSKGKVLVHCRAGISRSATLVCAFLMLKRGLTAQEAVRAVRKHRAIIPNDGFLKQLCDLNDKIRR